MNTSAGTPDDSTPAFKPSRLKRYASFLRYLIVGSSNSIMDILLFMFFATLLQFHPVWANVLSTAIVVTISFFLNHRFVFRSDKNRRSTAVQFVAITVFNGWVIQSIVIWAVVSVCHTWPFFVEHTALLDTFSKIVAMGVGFIFNYFGYKILFQSSKKRTA